MRIAFALAFATALLACTDGDAPKEAPQSRYGGVKRTASSAATKSFCEVSFPAGETGKTFTAPAEKPVPGVTPSSAPAKGWRWVNLWATWCHPCIEEIGLLGKWQTSLEKDGIPLTLDLYSVDDDAEALSKWLSKSKMPGNVRWLKGGAADLPVVLESLGVDKGAPIPVHALIDGNNKLRCVRTGSVHDEDYGAVKAILSGG